MGWLQSCSRCHAMWHGPKVESECPACRFQESGYAATLNTRTVLPDEIDEDPPKDGTYLHMGVAYCSHCGSAAHTGETCRVPGTATDWRAQYEQMDRARDKKVAELRARVAELEADVLKMRGTGPALREPFADDRNEMRLRIAGLQEGLERCEEDLRRKREECERLEQELCDKARRIMHLTEKDGVSGRRITELQVEVDRLRRELGKR